MLLISATLKRNIRDYTVICPPKFRKRIFRTDLILLAADQVNLGDEGRLELKFGVHVHRALVAFQQLAHLVKRIWNF